MGAGGVSPGRETRIKNQMDLQFFFFEITDGCNINREQEQIFMFKLYLKFPGTAEMQSQREGPEVAGAPLRLLWGRRLCCHKSATSKPGRHSCQNTDFSLWAALSTHLHSQILHRMSLTRDEAELWHLHWIADPEQETTSPKPPRVTPATSMPAAPKKTDYKPQPASRGQPAPRACS